MGFSSAIEALGTRREAKSIEEGDLLTPDVFWAVESRFQELQSLAQRDPIHYIASSLEDGSMDIVDHFVDPEVSGLKRYSIGAFQRRFNRDAATFGLAVSKLIRSEYMRQESLAMIAEDAPKPVFRAVHSKPAVFGGANIETYGFELIENHERVTMEVEHRDMGQGKPTMVRTLRVFGKPSEPGKRLGTPRFTVTLTREEDGREQVNVHDSNSGALAPSEVVGILKKIGLKKNR